MATLTVELKRIAKRLTNTRAQIVKELPFFGRLLLHLQFGFADCETAYTDQKRIVFDLEFADRLSDDELKFIMLHELFHCVLNHCSRAKGKVNLIYNIACDIVVNSILLDMLDLDEIAIDGNKAMHLAPDDSEGKEHTADEIYQMLLNLSENKVRELYGNGVDNHTVWAELNPSSKQNEIWRTHIKSASKACSIEGLPLSLKRYVKDISRNPKCNWKQILHDFIQFDKSDYTYTIPDKRFAGGDVIMPSFQDEIDGARVRRLWAVVDTSASISNAALNDAMNEIYGALTQVNLEGWVSFFDTDVSEPVPFESAEDLDKISPVGGGGTSFDIIFDSIVKHFSKDYPEIIVILTDGYAPFPEEKAALGIPVIWTIIDSDINPPWGKTVHITTND